MGDWGQSYPVFLLEFLNIYKAPIVARLPADVLTNTKILPVQTVL